MWIPWNIGQAGAMMAAVVFAYGLAAMLGRVAHVLPQRLLLSDAPRLPPRRRARYVVLPVLTSAFAAVVVWAFGATPAALAAIVFIAMLIALAWIDAETGLLPDLLTQPLLWLGLLVNLNPTFASLPDAVLGAVAGYLILWCVHHAFLWLTGREGMGHGDFKLLAAIGAWLGWAALPWILLGGSSLALVTALALRSSGRMARGDALSFGPYLAVAGVVALFALFAPL